MRGTLKQKSHRETLNIGLSALTSNLAETIETERRQQSSVESPRRHIRKKKGFQLSLNEKDY